jgi:transcriptional regulator with XRE-family HTH domain
MENNLAERIKTLRGHYNLSIKEFAHKCGLSHVAIFQLEKGKTLQPHKSTLMKIAMPFGVQTDWILHGKGDMLPNGTNNIHEPILPADMYWQQEAYQAMKQKNILLEQEVDRLWQLLSQYTKSREPEYKNNHVLEG